MTLITNIQKYSIHDGDGIRTSVFFKGCPLNCVWCHNPETQAFQKEVLYDAEKCVGCYRCADACPEHAIKKIDGKVWTDKEICDKCGKCLDYCVRNLREIAGTEWQIEDLVKELKKDEMFYEESGGGVTLSGGEVMSQNMDYIEKLVKRLNQEGISVTIDTCGFAPYENFERILPYVDTFLYDIKVMDHEKHKKYIGVDNTLILQNVVRLSQAGARIYIRIPTIKEVNGDVESISAIIAFLKENGIHPAQVNLLPYHNTGSGKYGKLGELYEGEDLHAPSKEEMKELRQLFIQEGFQNTKIGG